MTTEQVLNAAKAHAIAFPRDSQALRDWLDCLIALYKERPTRSLLLDYRAFLRGNLRSGVLIEDSYEMLRISYLLSAPDHFEDYMLALEWKRPAKEKFYLPRQKVLAPSVMALQRMLDGELDELFLSQPARTGKLLADSTPVLTSEGWRTHGELKVGDRVIGLDGEFKRVLAVHPKQMTTHTVTVSDGSTFKCHANHEWVVYDRGTQKDKVYETAEMLRLGLRGGKDHRNRFNILSSAPVVGESQTLHVDPYTLGAWLGDGTNTKPWLSNDPNDVAIHERCAYPIRRRYVHKTTGVVSAEFEGLNTDLRKYGMCFFKRTTEKYIPTAYLLAPTEQRLALLAGLLDTDGTLCREERRYHFSTTSERLRDDFCALVATFGWRCSVTAYAPKLSSSGIQGRKTVYTIGFNPMSEVPCELPRKQLTTFSRWKRLSITSIAPSEPEQGNCITVEGGVYRVGRALIPTHNSTLLLMFVTFVVGKWPELSNLYSAYSDNVTGTFYKGILEIIGDPVTYAWGEIFPERRIAGTDAKAQTLNIDRRKRYASVTCRSIDGSLNGTCDCQGFLVADDLIEGIEEAMSKDRLIKKLRTVQNDLYPRAKNDAKIVWMGTRWSMLDPIGVRLELLQNDAAFAARRWADINTPALDPATDESNFHYKYGVGFSTEHYRQVRAAFERNNDMASWFTQYQGQPMERTGTLFSPDEMRFWNGILPDTEPDRTFAAVDPAWGGGDATACWIAKQYGEEVYIVDMVYSFEDKTRTQPTLAQRFIDWGVTTAQFECNKMTEAYKEGVEKELANRGVKINLMTRAAPNNKSKEQRIYDKAPEIRKLIFLEDGKRTKEYSLSMQNVFSFKLSGGNKHDDSPDVGAQLVGMIRGQQYGKVEFGRRPF